MAKLMTLNCQRETLHFAETGPWKQESISKIVPDNNPPPPRAKYVVHGSWRRRGFPRYQSCQGHPASL